MPRRFIAATAAVLLAVTGAFVLVSYVSGADERARADEDLVQVLVVDAEVPAGSPASGLGVTAVEVPRRLVASDAVTDVSELGERVASTVLLPGEQLRSARFVDASRIADPGTVIAPDGLVEVSLTLDAQRAVAGAVRPGDVVGVQVGGDRLTGVLVTRIAGPENGGDPTASYLVTLALSPEQASSVATASTTEPVWLSLEKRSGAVEDTGSGTTTVSLGGDQ